MREIQGSFGHLRLPLDINDTQRRLHLLETCFRLYDVKARLRGVDHIRSVYFGSTTTEERPWEGMEHILSRLRYVDRVSRFHQVPSGRGADLVYSINSTTAGR